jgi:hypothetical protein
MMLVASEAVSLVIDHIRREDYSGQQRPLISHRQVRVGLYREQ